MADEQVIKNTKPKVSEFHNKYNDAVIPRDKDGMFTHSQTAEESYNKNYVDGGGNPPPPANPVIKNDNQLLEKVSNDAFLAQKKLPEEIIDCFVKLEEGETISKLILNNNGLTDSKNKIDAYVEIYDKDGNTVDALFIDFKHKNSWMGEQLSSFNGKSFDFCLGKVGSNGIIPSSFGNPEEMSQVTLFGLIDTNNANKDVYLNGIKNNTGTPSNKMTLAAVNKVALKESFLKDLFQENKTDMDTRLQAEAQKILNQYTAFTKKDSNNKRIIDDIRSQTNSKQGFYYESGWRADKYGNLSYNLTEEGAVKLVVKKVNQYDKKTNKTYFQKSINIKIDYTELEKLGIAKTMKGN